MYLGCLCGFVCSCMRGLLARNERLSAHNTLHTYAHIRNSYKHTQLCTHAYTNTHTHTIFMLYSHASNSQTHTQVPELERAGEVDLEKRVELLIQSTCYMVFAYVAQGLFERHKLIVATQVCVCLFCVCMHV